MNLERKPIHDFRDLMAAPEILTIFRNRDGRNEWNVICSAMDWIETAIDGINTDTLSCDNSNEASIKFITFLACIDILWEGVQQLHRVLIDRSTIPFANEDNIFKQKLSVYDAESGMPVQSDNAYYKNKGNFCRPSCESHGSLR